MEMNSTDEFIKNLKEDNQGITVITHKQIMATKKCIADSAMQIQRMKPIKSHFEKVKVSE